jgi:hypothetical protein
MAGCCTRAFCSRTIRLPHATRCSPLLAPGGSGGGGPGSVLSKPWWKPPGPSSWNEPPSRSKSARATDRAARAGRAHLGPSRPERHRPLVPARAAAKASLPDERDGATGDAQGPAVDERPGDLPSRGFHDAGERRPRHPHAGGGLLLVETLEIRQTQGLELVHAQRDLLEHGGRNPGGLEVGEAWRLADAAGAGWPRHFTPLRRGGARRRDEQARTSLRIVRICS